MQQCSSYTVHTIQVYVNKCTTHNTDTLVHHANTQNYHVQFSYSQKTTWAILYAMSMEEESIQLSTFGEVTALVVRRTRSQWYNLAHLWCSWPQYNHWQVMSHTTVMTYSSHKGRPPPHLWYLCLHSIWSSPCKAAFLQYPRCIFIFIRWAQISSCREGKHTIPYVQPNASRPCDPECT